MKINVICQYYPPEIGAPQARLSEMAREWKLQGHDVTVLTGFPNHPTGIIPSEYKGKIFMEEFRDGIKIWRHWLYATPNEKFFKKTCAHLSFMVSVIFLSIFRGKRPDVFIVSSPNFFSVISTYIFSYVRQVPFIFEVRDLWPAIFVDLGVLRNRCLIRILENIELFLYRKSAAVVPLTHGFAKDMIRRGISENKIEVITNGVDLDVFRPDSKNKILRSKLGLFEWDFVILYIGAHGISHGLPKILDAAKMLCQEKNIQFVFVGEGAVKAKLIEIAREKRLKNVTFLPGQKKEQVVDFYHIADVCLVPLRDVAGFDAFIPSKMFEIMGCAKPIIGSVRGEAAEILTKSKSALIIPPENPEELVKAIGILKSNPQLCRTMGENGCCFVEEYYDRKMLARKYSNLIEKVVNLKEKANENSCYRRYRVYWAKGPSLSYGKREHTMSGASK